MNNRIQIEAIKNDEKQVALLKKGLAQLNERVIITVINCLVRFDSNRYIDTAIPL